MVASGLPTVYDRHAQEMSLLALELLDSVKQHVIPHLPEEKLRLRIGLHSGALILRTLYAKNATIYFCTTFVKCKTRLFDHRYTVFHQGGWFWKQPSVVISSQFQFQASNITRTFASDYCLCQHTLPVFLATDLLHHSPHSARTQPVFASRRRNSSPFRIGTYHSRSCIMPRIRKLPHLVRTVAWPHVRLDEQGCLTAQKLDHVMSAVCWCIALPCWKTNTSPAMLQITGSSSCISNTT